MAPIRHAYQEQNTQQTTSSLTYVDAMSVPSSAFRADAKYAIFVKAKIGGNSNTVQFGFKVKDDNGDLLGSEMLMEPVGTTDNRKHNYFYAWEYEPGATPSNVVFQFKVVTSGTARADQIALVAFDEADFPPGTFFFAEDDDTGAPTQHTTTFVPRASNTFTPDNNNNDWLLFACAQTLINSITVQYEMRLDVDSGAETQPSMSEEGEKPDEIKVQTVMRVHTLSDSSHTIACHVRDDATGVNDHNASMVMGIRLDNFEDHGFVWTEDAFTFASAGTPEELATTTVNFATTGDIFVFGQGIGDAGAPSRSGMVFIQVDGTTSPTGDDVQLNSRSYDGDDENVYSTFARVAISSGSRQIDMDGEVSNTSLVIEDRSLAVFSAELVGAGPAEQPLEAVSRRVSIRSY